MTQDPVTFYPYGFFLFYDAGTGNGLTTYIDYFGLYSLVFYPGGFSPSWTHVTGGDVLLFYDANSGRGATGRVNDDGSFTTLHNYDRLVSCGTSWTHVVGDAAGFVLLYNVNSGLTGALYVDSDLLDGDCFGTVGTWTHAAQAG